MTPNLDRGELERQRDALLAQVRGLGNLMRGTVVEVGVKCGRAGCGCAGGEKHRKIHLAVNLQGRSHGCYLGQERAEVVAPLIAEYERAWGLINALTAVNLALVRGTHPGGRPGRKRKRRAACRKGCCRMRWRWAPAPTR